MLMLEKDMPHNLLFKEIGNGKLRWVPNNSDTLDDLIKEYKVNISFLVKKGQPHIENWEELVSEINRRKALPLDGNKSKYIIKSDRRRAYFSECRIRQWTWFGRIAAFLFIVIAHISVSTLICFFPEYVKLFLAIDIICILFALIIPGRFVEIAECLRIEIGFRASVGVRMRHHLTEEQVRCANKQKLKIQKRLGIILTAEEMAEWSKYI